jgi:hypothetical protein
MFPRYLPVTTNRVRCRNVVCYSKYNIINACVQLALSLVTDSVRSLVPQRGEAPLQQHEVVSEK